MLPACMRPLPGHLAAHTCRDDWLAPGNTRAPIVAQALLERREPMGPAGLAVPLASLERPGLEV